MKKLKLNLEALAVEELPVASFETEEDTARRNPQGTVQGNMVFATQQVRCTYFCTYTNCTGLPCA